MSIALVVGVLTATGVFLVLQTGRSRIVLGFALLAHAVNVLLVAGSTGTGRAAPFDDVVGQQADPVPQAFVLTSIVISFGVTALLLAIASRQDPGVDRDEARPPSDDRAADRDEVAR